MENYSQQMVEIFERVRSFCEKYNLVFDPNEGEPSEESLIQERPQLEQMKTEVIRKCNHISIYRLCELCLCGIISTEELSHYCPESRIAEVEILYVEYKLQILAKDICNLLKNDVHSIPLESVSRVVGEFQRRCQSVLSILCIEEQKHFKSRVEELQTRVVIFLEYKVREVLSSVSSLSRAIDAYIMLKSLDEIGDNYQSDILEAESLLKYFSRVEVLHSTSSIMQLYRLGRYFPEIEMLIYTIDQYNNVFPCLPNKSWSKYDSNQCLYRQLLILNDFIKVYPLSLFVDAIRALFKVAHSNIDFKWLKTNDVIHAIECGILDVDEVEEHINQCIYKYNTNIDSNLITYLSSDIRHPEVHTFRHCVDSHSLDTIFLGGVASEFVIQGLCGIEEDENWLLHWQASEISFFEKMCVEKGIEDSLHSCEPFCIRCDVFKKDHRFEEMSLRIYQSSFWFQGIVNKIMHSPKMDIFDDEFVKQMMCWNYKIVNILIDKKRQWITIPEEGGILRCEKDEVLICKNIDLLNFIGKIFWNSVLQINIISYGETDYTALQLKKEYPRLYSRIFDICKEYYINDVNIIPYSIGENVFYDKYVYDKTDSVSLLHHFLRACPLRRRPFFRRMLDWIIPYHIQIRNATS